MGTVYDEMTDGDLAEQLCALSHMEENIPKLWESSFAILLANEFPALEEVIVEKLAKELTPHMITTFDITKQVAGLLIQHLSRDELIELISLYSNPTMQKYLQMGPVMYKDLRTILESQISTLSSEARERIKDILREHLDEKSLGGLK